MLVPPPLKSRHTHSYVPQKRKGKENNSPRTWSALAVGGAATPDEEEEEPEPDPDADDGAAVAEEGAEAEAEAEAPVWCFWW